MPEYRPTFTDTAQMTVTEIKAELYDLRSHDCNGRITLRTDGTCDPTDHSCDYCARVSVLQNYLRRTELMRDLGIQRHKEVYRRLKERSEELKRGEE